MSINIFKNEVKVDNNEVKEDKIRKYPKVFRIDNYPKKEKFPMDKPVFIQEKLDGSNITLEFIKDENGMMVLNLYSRMRKIDINSKDDKKNWNSFFIWVKEREDFLISEVENLYKIGDLYPNAPLLIHGEWLNMAKLSYNKTHKNSFWVFDIKMNGYFLEMLRLYKITNLLKLNNVPHISEEESLSSILENMDSYIKDKKTLLDGSDSKREGIVVKTICGGQRIKFVSNDFKESMGTKKEKNAPLFIITQKIITEQRVQKYIQKIKEMGIIDKNIDYSNGENIKNIFKNQKLLIDDFMEEEFKKLLNLVKQQIGRECSKALKEFVKEQQKIEK